MYTRETIDELNALSLKVFGKKSRWKKLVERGHLEPLMETATRLLDPVTGKTEQIEVPVNHVGKNGGEVPKAVISRYTVDSIKEYMLTIIAKHDEMMAAINKANQEKADAKRAQELIAKASGSAT